MNKRRTAQKIGGTKPKELVEGPFDEKITALEKH